MLEAILSDIESERHVQDAKWGGPDHDDTHGPNDWIAFTVRKLGEAQDAFEAQDSGLYRVKMTQAAALVVAALESHNRRVAMDDWYREPMSR